LKSIAKVGEGGKVPIRFRKVGQSGNEHENPIVPRAGYGGDKICATWA